jgi:hypothetical protein
MKFTELAGTSPTGLEAIYSRSPKTRLDDKLHRTAQSGNQNPPNSKRTLQSRRRNRLQVEIRHRKPGNATLPSSTGWLTLLPEG